MSRTPPPESGKARTDVRKGSILSTDDVRSVADGRSIPIDALEMPPPEVEIDTIGAAMPDFDLDAFMNEKVEINVATSAIEGDLAFAEPSVQGVSVVIPRGRNVIVKRKFVEVLARAKSSSYNQAVLNIDQANIQTPLNENVSLAYPFAVITDTPRGKRWLNDILREPR